MKYLILTIASIFVIPLFGTICFPSGSPVWFPQCLGLLFCLFLGMSVVLWKFNKYLSIFTLICLFSTFFVSTRTARSFILLFHLDLMCLAAYGISRFNYAQRKILRHAVLGLVLLQFLWLIMQAWNLDPVFHKLANPAQDAMVGLSASKDQIGTFFALTMPAILPCSLFLSFLSNTGICISESSFALVAGNTASLIYLFYFHKKVFLIGLILLIFVTGLFFWKFENLKLSDFQTRFAVWKHAVKSTIRGNIEVASSRHVKDTETYYNRRVIKCNPIFGYGFGNFLNIFPQVPQDDKLFNYRNEKFTHAHNDFVELFFELGYCVISLFVLVINGIYRFFRAGKTKELAVCFCVILAYLLNASGNFLSQLAVSGMILVLFYGMFEGILREQREARVGQVSQLA